MRLDPDHGQGLHSFAGPGLATIVTEPKSEVYLNMPRDGPPGVWQHMIDGLTEQVALVDESWTLLFVNESWSRAAELYGHFVLTPGTNLLSFFRTLAAAGREVSRAVVAGIEEIELGKRSSFDLSFRSSSPEIGRDYQLRINRFEANGRTFASVTRYDVSKLIELRKLREDFSDSVIKLQAEERLHIGREIHNSTMQLMVCLDMKIGQLKQSCKTAACGTILDEMSELVAHTQEEIRSISYLIHPPVLGRMTLLEALDALVDGFGHRTGFSTRFESGGAVQICCPAAEGALYRIVQEALSNVRRHSKTNSASVRLTQGKRMAHAIIADDGVGMPKAIRSGVGLSGMRSRLSELGGRLSIRSSPLGTTVIASVPAQRCHRLGADPAC